MAAASSSVSETDSDEGGEALSLKTESGGIGGQERRILIIVG